MNISLLTMAALNASLDNILRIYGLLCLMSMPFGLWIMISMYRKNPDAVKKAGEKINKILDGESTPENNNNIKNPVPENTTTTNENDEFGIATLILNTGDRYQCHLSELNIKNNRGGEYNWSTDNPFVGAINEFGGVFTARKAGRTYIEFGTNRMRIYYADIRPKNTAWIGHNPTTDILERKDITYIKCREAAKKTKILTLDDTRGILTYKIPEGTVTYMYDSTGCIRVLMNLSSDRETPRETERNMEEFFDRLWTPDLPEGRSYWYHKSGFNDVNGYPDSVDIIAMIRPSRKGGIRIGIGEVWRPGADVSEIEENIEMADRSFAALLEKDEIPANVGSTLNPDDNSRKEDTVKPAANQNPLTTETDKNDEQDNRAGETNNPDSNINAEEENNGAPDTKEIPTVPETDDLPDTDDPENNNEDANIGDWDGEEGEDDPFAHYRTNDDLDTNETNN